MPQLFGTIFRIAFFAFPFLASSITIDCSNIITDDRKYDLDALKGPHTVQSYTKITPPSTSEITFTVDICELLGKDSSLKDKEQCPNGTRGQ